jgi:hypothetical protein
VLNFKIEAKGLDVTNFRAATAAQNDLEEMLKADSKATIREIVDKVFIDRTLELKDVLTVIRTLCGESRTILMDAIREILIPNDVSCERTFSEAEKNILRDIEIEIVRQLIPYNNAPRHQIK